MNFQKTLLSCLEVNPTQPATASIIWLHGLGATNDDFVPIANELQQLTALPIRFIFPQAPSRPVTINKGYIMPAWYDIISFDRMGIIDEQGIKASVEQISAIITREKHAGIASENILIAGFSQGAVIALSTLFNSSEMLGGVIGLSGYLPSSSLTAAKFPTSIFLGHGMMDDIVPFELGEIAREALKKAGYPVSWNAYPMPHSVCPEEIQDIARWLKGILERE
jgi:phospholipase/carboxylesterase